MPGKAERKNMERKTELLKMTVAGGLSDLANNYGINIKKMSKCAIVDAILDYEEKNGKKKKIATKNTINTKLKAMRIKSGLTQREVAEKIGMNIKLYAQYEQGAKSFDSVNLRVMLTVCLALGCRIEEVIESKEILQLINQYENGKNIILTCSE
jgi:DNA-binding XRE family transcriptional regulator